MTRYGFTFIELTVAIAVLTTLTSLATVNLLAVQNRASISTAVSTLLADLRAQQIKAISGDTEGSGTSDSHGVFFTSTGYILFRGSVYAPQNPTNFTINLETPLTISAAFPGSEIVFSIGNGEIPGYNSNTDTVVITNPVTTETYTLELNRYGVVTQYN